MACVPLFVPKTSVSMIFLYNEEVKKLIVNSFMHEEVKKLTVKSFMHLSSNKSQIMTNGNVHRSKLSV